MPSFNLTSVPQALLLPSLAWRGNSDCHCAHSRQLLGIDKNIRFPRRWPECARCRIRVTSSASSTVRLSESIPSLSTTTPMLPSFSLSLLLCVLQCVGPVDTTTIIIIYNKDTTQCLSFVKSSGSVEDAKSTVVVLRIRPWVGRNRDVDGTCPPSHPVKIPKIGFFVRVAPYEGGQHVFSDGTTRMHADYFSGWEESFLQSVLDGCDNGSFFSADDQFCEDFLTGKDLPKVGSSCGTLESNLAKIQAVQPPPLDMSTITDEVIGGVMTLSRGEGTRG